MTMPFLSIIGIGEDGTGGLSQAAKDCISAASLVIGGARHLALARTLIHGETETWTKPMEAALPRILARRPAKVAVLASGDPFFHGVGTLLSENIPAGEWHCIPAISCRSLACARLGWKQQTTQVVSLCGHPIDHLAPALFPGRRLLVLSSDEATPAAVAAYLSERGFGPSRITLLEALGGPHERIRHATAAGFDLAEPNRLNLLAIELEATQDAAIASLVPGRPDDAFDNDGQITKYDIRAITLSALAPTPGALLWDIGSGSGSIAIEWLLTHPANRAIAIDRHQERLTRAGDNARRLGVPELRCVLGDAPTILGDLPMPDAIFLGGGAHLPGMIEAASAALRPGGKLVANAIALETETALAQAFRAQGGTLSRIAIERLRHVGRMSAFRPAMTVTQYVWVKS
jgi:precorrin-6Y C5,15-methyltransferase (decarboxylating)